MKAGMLRTPVVLQRPSRAESSAFGDGFTVTHTSAATVYADARPVSGDERDREGLHVSERFWKIRIRHRTDVRTGWRVSWDGRLVNLTRVEDPTGRKQELHLYGAEQSNPEAGS